jgi:site-specific DNA recombinase
VAKSAALYARVSSEQQAETGTIESQISALIERIQADGHGTPSAELQFIDNGFSGAKLVRPGLERLRDAAFNGAIDCLYVHSPDRLARKYAYQIVLVDELRKAGVDVIFLNREIGKTPEDDLLLQVQGMMAEYERAKIMERARRGKLQAARRGDISVLARAPYGYRYVTRHDGGGDAQYEIIFEEARIVQQIFDWVGKERVTMGTVVQRLEDAGIKSKLGKPKWDRTTIWMMLKNPAYMGQAAFGKSKVVERKIRLRPARNASATRTYSKDPVPEDEWISIPVPAIITPELFAAVQQQVADNRTKARARRHGAVHLLQGLISCKQCGYAYYGKPIRKQYVYYRCIGSDAHRFGGKRVCDNPQIRADMLDDAVWAQACQLLQNPERLQAEYKRRLKRKTVDDPAKLDAERKKIQSKIARIIDSYADGLVTKDEFEPRIKRAKQQLAKINEQTKRLTEENGDTEQLQLIIVRLDEFAAKIKDKLQQVDWATKREIIRSLIQRIEMDEGKVKVVFRVTSLPFDLPPVGGKNTESLQHCRARFRAST